MSDDPTLLRRFRLRCKERGICTHCFSRPAIKGLTRCKHCKRAQVESQPARLRRTYLRDIAAGKCVRCHKGPQQATNKRCVKCEAYHYAHKGKKRNLNPSTHK
jgi:hypothetical protein